MVKREPVSFDIDEFVRTDAAAGDFARLKPMFQKDGPVTADNASGINDGEAAVVLARGEAVNTHELKPIARLAAYGHAGVDPAYMGIGPIPATRKALEPAG
jgi:acetyl-CoA C-acetyltransferase